MSRLNDSCVVVTGGASGIGAATADRFRRDGETVVILDRRLVPAQAFAEEIGAIAIELNVADDRKVAEVIDKIETSIGPIGVLVNCAGPLQNTDRPQDLPMTVWDRIVGVHLRGTYRVSVEVGLHMVARRRGSIVSVASVMGMRSGPLHAYGPAKAGLINLMEGLAAEWGPSQVRVNTVSPGFVETPGLHRGIDEKVMELEHMRSSSALQRTLQPAEVAAAIHFLASDAASGITGVNLPVDAGFLVAGSWNAYGGLR